MIPGVTASERADGPAYPAGEAAENRLAARLMPAAKQPMHHADRRGVKRAKSRRVQGLSEKKQREVLRGPTDDEEAHHRQPEACDEYGTQPERRIQARQP